MSYDKEIYENGSYETNDFSRLEINSSIYGETIWVQSGLAGLSLSKHEFEVLYPLLRGYAERIGIENG